MIAATEDLVSRIDGIEYTALHDLWSAVPPAQAHDAGLIHARLGGCLVIGSTHTPSTEMLNRVMGAGAADVDDGSLAAAIDVLRGAGCVCQVGVRDDGAAGRAARRWLESEGFVDAYRWMKFVHDPEAATEPPPARVRVRPCDDADGQAFGATLVAGFGLPPSLAVIGRVVVNRPGWRCYLAEDADGAPVGVGATYVDGDVAWLGMGATVPEARRKGAQGALLRRRIDDARRLGCSLIVTETGERVADRPSGSYRNILRAGFVEHGLRRHLVSPAAAGRSGEARVSAGR